MTLNRLQDDLLQDFKEQKHLIKEQIELFDPLATSLRQPAAQRLISKGGILFSEILCYLLSLGSLAFAILMNLVYPFDLLSQFSFDPQFKNGLSLNHVEFFNIAVHGLAGFIAILFYIMARILRRIRLKNAILHLAGSNIKSLMGQHLKRKASIDAIEQRHFQELPEERTLLKVNEVPNPGYDS